VQSQKCKLGTDEEKNEVTMIGREKFEVETFFAILDHMRSEYENKNFWEELICLLSLHKLTVDNIQCHHLHTKFHPNPPSVQKLHPPEKFKHSQFWNG
jgi:hypothetical protein